MASSGSDVLRSVLWTEQSGRLRAPWRLLVALFVLGGAGAVGVAVVPVVGDVLAALVGGAGDEAVAGQFVRTTVGLIGLAGSIVVGIYLVARFVDRRWFRDLGMRIDADWWADLAFGLALGGCLMTGVFLVELAFGWVSITGIGRVQPATAAFWPWLVVTVALWIAVGVYEELLARGYLLTNLAEGLTYFERLGRVGAVSLARIASAFVFAGLHATNPNASVWSTIGIFVAGLMLAAGYVLTGELAVPIGVHVTWNLFQGTVFGFPVSGIGQHVSVIALEQRGPALLTGGEFGPEAGLIGVAASTGATLSILVWTRIRHGRIGICPSILRPEPRHGDDSVV